MSGLVPTGTVTLLLADVEGSSRLWETQAEEMTAAFANLDRTVAQVVTTHEGVRPVEQGEGDSFVVAFARASDAVACALQVQRAPLGPIRLRIGIHTGEVQLRDGGNYIGPAINRAARLRDLAHGGQTVLSGITHDLVVDRLPVDAWLTDLGTHRLRDLPHPERVVQLCHPDLCNEFPPLRTVDTVAAQHLPVQLTSFVGRAAQISEVGQLLTQHRLVTLSGAGGVGKTRLAVQVAAAMAGGFGAGVWYVDLAPITDPVVVPGSVARTFGLPDQPGRSTMDALARFIGERQMLLMLDNCEHLLDACAALIVALLSACPGLTLLTTSRESIGVPGEVTWRVPSLAPADEAIKLFTDRARHVRPQFRLTDDNAATVTEICRRLDGIPLAIELAAAWVRALSPSEIVDGLHDRFRLLTGGTRTAMRRQHTLRASVDWSHALLTKPERVLFRRLAVFLGGFDLEAAQAVCGAGDVARYQILDELAQLVDKSLVVAENTRGSTRYRLLETVRQYALEKLGDAGEADELRGRHRDHYTSMATSAAGLLERPAQAGRRRRIEQAEIDIDNLRAAFAWSLERRDLELALRLASSLQPVWLARGRVREGLAWFDAALTEENPHIEVAPAARARALTDKAMLAASIGATDRMEQAKQALAIARELDDPALKARALTACGGVAIFNAEVAQPYLAEANELARALGDRWTLSGILVWQAYGGFLAGDPIATYAAAQEGRGLGDALGHRFGSHACRFCLGWAQMMHGELAAATAQFGELVADAEAAHDNLWRVHGLFGQGYALAHHGDTGAARAAASTAIEAAAELGGLLEGVPYAALTVANLAAGDVEDAADAGEVAWQKLRVEPTAAAIIVYAVAQTALARGDLTAARDRAEDAVSAATGWHLSMALITRARVAIAQGQPERAERDAHDALAVAGDVQAYLTVPDILECLAALADDAGSHREAARLFGAAAAIRQRFGAVRFTVYQAGYEAAVAAVRDVMGDNDFECAWAEGAALSTEEAIAYARRGRGERKRPTSGWASLTPTERDVVRLVGEGLANKAIATRLFVSPRTVQTHLTHVYTKLGINSRVQLAQEAARHP